MKETNEMNSLETLETLLASRKPRTPSRKLELRPIQRVAEGDDGAISGSLPFRLPWLAPTSAMASLVILTLCSAPARLPSAIADVAGFGNASFLAAIQTAETHSAANNLVAARFTLTNLSLSPGPISYGLGTNLPF